VTPLERKKEYAKSPAGKLSKKKTRLMSRYGITMGDYDEMLEAQGGVCGICNKGNQDKTFHVDHEHDMQVRSGALVDVNIGNKDAVRGLLCGPCNRALGAFQDSREVLLSAADWVTNKGIS
jgi:hypothetical protein